MNNPWVLFAFLSIFHIIGASVLASALRELWHDLRDGCPRGCRLAFLTLWAIMFGCLPLGFGIDFAGTETGTPLFLLGQILVWVSTFLVAFLAGQALKDFLEPFPRQETLLMLLGGAFVVAGGVVASLMADEEGLSRPVIGGLFALVGSTIFVYGLRSLLRSTR